jgi:hypothetical protein
LGIFAAGQKPLASRFNAVANSGGINNACGAGTHNTTSYASLPATSSFSFTKLHSSTALLIDFHLSMYSTLAATVIRLGVLVNSVDYDVANFYFNEASAHRQISGASRITGIAAGTYTIQARWRQVSGTGVLTVDGNDWISLQALEVQ